MFTQYFSGFIHVMFFSNEKVAEMEVLVQVRKKGIPRRYTYRATDYFVSKRLAVTLSLCSQEPAPSGAIGSMML